MNKYGCVLCGCYFGSLLNTELTICPSCLAVKREDQSNKVNSDLFKNHKPNTLLQEKMQEAIEKLKETKNLLESFYGVEFKIEFESKQSLGILPEVKVHFIPVRPIRRQDD